MAAAAPTKQELVSHLSFPTMLVQLGILSLLAVTILANDVQHGCVSTSPQQNDIVVQVNFYYDQAGTQYAGHVVFCGDSTEKTFTNFPGRYATSFAAIVKCSTGWDKEKGCECAFGPNSGYNKYISATNGGHSGIENIGYASVYGCSWPGWF